MTPSDPTALNMRQQKNQPAMQPQQPAMPPPGMPLPPQPVPTVAGGNPYAPGQPTGQLPIQQQPAMPAPTGQPIVAPAQQGQANQQSNLHPIASRPQPNAPMKPPMPTNGRPMSTAKKPTPMGG